MVIAVVMHLWLLLIAASGSGDLPRPNGHASILPGRPEYFSKVFTGHHDAARLFTLLNLEFPGLEPVAELLLTGKSKDATETLLAYFRDRCRSWTVVNHTYSWMRSVEIADDALQGKFTRFGGAAKPREVQFDHRGIDWQTNPFWEKDKDAEWAWGFHRQPFWMSMAWAYTETGDERYAVGWKEQFLSWLAQNPRDPFYDYDWGDTFEVAVDGSRKLHSHKVWPNPRNPELSWAWRRVDAGRRGLQFPELMVAFINSEHFTPELLVAVLASAHEHGDFLANNPHRHFTRDNHGLFEAEGAAFLGVLFPEFSDAAVWRANAFALLKDQLEVQVRPDGLQLENVMNYQISAIRIFTDTPLLADANGIHAFPEWYWNRVKRMASVFQSMSFPNSMTAQFGDQAERMNLSEVSHKWGRFFAWHNSSDGRHHHWDNKPVYDRFEGGRPAFIQWLNGVCRDTSGSWYHPEGGWIQGCDGRVSECATSVTVQQHCREMCNACPADTPHTPSPPPPQSERLAWSGFFSIRNAWTPNASMLMLRCGPSPNAHSHKDAATFELFAGGRLLLSDSGCYTYTDIKKVFPDDLDRAYFSSTAAHNTLTLDNADAHHGSLLHGPFRRQRGYDDCGTLLWDPKPGATMLSVENRRTYRNPDLSHRRTVLQLEDGVFLIVDEAIGDATGLVESHFHFTPVEVADKVGQGTHDYTRGVSILSNVSVRTHHPSGGNLLLVASHAEEQVLRLHTSQMSAHMGQKVPRPAVSLQRKKRTGDTVRFAVALVPFTAGSKPPAVSLSVTTSSIGLIDHFSVNIAINGVLRTRDFDIDPALLQMTPPPPVPGGVKSKKHPELEYTPYYQSFLDSVLPTRKCSRIGDCKPRAKVPESGMVLKFPRRSLVVAKTKKFLYCGIPKCGVSRWRRLIRRTENIENWGDKNAHNPTANGLLYLSDLTGAPAAEALANDSNMYSFVIVRNPFTRLLSAWLDKRDFPKFKLSRDFGKFVRKLVATPTGKLNEHFLPMSRFCGVQEGMRFDAVLRLESVDDWGPKLVKRLNITAEVSTGWNGGFFRKIDDAVKHNHHSDTRIKEFYTPELQTLVARKYQEDFETFGYLHDRLPVQRKTHVGADIEGAGRANAHVGRIRSAAA